jgi:ElaB/YqjD/DUF883 family membrane-anchored ribosome-binding protein
MSLLNTNYDKPDLRPNSPTPISDIEKLSDKASETLHDVAEQAGHFATHVAEQGREAGDQVQKVAGNLKVAVDKSVKDQPMATLAMAAFAGFVLGAIWKS